jgi:hypothetical protein
MSLDQHFVSSNRFSKPCAGPTLYKVATEIRPASAADGPAIARVRRESWFAAYAGIIDAELIDRATAGGDDGRRASAPPQRSRRRRAGRPGRRWRRRRRCAGGRRVRRIWP